MTHMDAAVREAAVAALVALAASPDFHDRIDAGRALASFADSGAAAARLRTLILDPDDTAVTRVTVEALLRRRDVPALAIVAAAIPSADGAHGHWIDSGIRDALGWEDWTWTEAIRACENLPSSSGAQELLDWLTELRPSS